jgi:SP family myo-inositol transporter-like MFS transporter 13
LQHHPNSFFIQSSIDLQLPHSTVYPKNFPQTFFFIVSPPTATGIMSKADTKEQLEHLEDAGSPNSIQEVNIEDLDSIEQTKTGKYSWLVSITAAIGGMLFGYDTGIISAVLVYLGQDLGKTLTSQEKELITSVTSGGAFVGAIFAGATADRYGRKVAIYVGCVLFTVGAIIQAASFSVAQMTVGRVVVGFGVGSAAMIIPLYVIFSLQFISKKKN